MCVSGFEKCAFPVSKNVRFRFKNVRFRLRNSLLTRICLFLDPPTMGTALLSFDKRSPLFDLTVINFGLKWPMQPKSTSAWSPGNKTQLLLENRPFFQHEHFPPTNVTFRYELRKTT
jgi:hypothetical protein